MMLEEQIIRSCLDNNDNQKIVSLPLQFAYLAVDILAKQFTKLNSPHEHRIHYLGPRYTNTQTMHKKCAHSELSFLCKGVPDRKINKYRLDVKRIANSFFINERLRTNHFYKTGLYYRAFQGMNPTLDLSQEFLFNGCFESANLDCVIKFKPSQFDLFLRIDSNTRGHTQWFFFSIANGNKMQKIRLNICNISKPGTFYESEMQPYVFSKKAFQTRNQLWTQGDSRISNVSFSQKEFNYKYLADKITAEPYCYSFDYQFQFQQDEVFFAYCIPYTYSQLLEDIELLPMQYVRTYTLGRSLTGLDIPLLHITDHTIDNNQKRNLIITGRVHPGQSNGSHVLKGFINYLCSSQKPAAELRKSANFYIVPMLNPDGVVLGNSRCSASGRDLNRVFLNSDKQLFPQIYSLKNFTQKILNHKEILMYLDFHGHSKKKNTFFYGPVYPLASPNYLKCRVLPRIIQKINSGFRYYSCMFSISESKKSTGRATMFQTFQIPYTYTVQSSIGYYYDSQQLKTFPFSRQSYIKMGSSICEGISTFVGALDQYDLFLKERRAERQKRKSRSFIYGRKGQNKIYQFHEEQMIENYRPTGNLKIYYKQNEQCLFVKLIQQLKALPVSVSQSGQKKLDDPQIDKQLSSDDHDEKQDFEVTKLKQFNNLIIQNARKDVLISKIVETQKKQFIRSGNFTNQEMTKSSRNIPDQQAELFQQLNIKTEKSKSSHGNRARIFLEDRPQTKNVRRKLIKRQISFQEQNNQQNDISISDKKKQQSGLKEDAMEMFFDDKLNLQENRQKRQIKKRSSTLGRGDSKSKWRAQMEKAPHFSQMHFPEQQKIQQRRLLKHQKTDLFRKNIERRRQRDDKTRLQNLNCSEMTIIKHPKKQIIQYQNKTQKRLTEFKIDDLMSNLQFRSKMLKDSVKYKQPKQFKLKSNFMFPSSFYGVKQQLSSKKRSSSYNKQSVQEEPLSITIKNFYK